MRGLPAGQDTAPHHHPATPPPTTTSHGGSFQYISATSASTASTRSPGPWMALVHTGGFVRRAIDPDAWAGPEWATFLSTASNFWPGTVPTPYYGAIFRARVY